MRAKVTSWVLSLIFIFHLMSYYSKCKRISWKFKKAITGSSWSARIIVSSENMPNSQKLAGLTCISEIKLALKFYPVRLQIWEVETKKFLLLLVFCSVRFDCYNSVGRDCLILYSRPSCQNLSIKRSPKKTAAQYFVSR